MPPRCAKDQCRVEHGCPGSVLDRDPVPPDRTTGPADPRAGPADPSAGPPDPSAGPPVPSAGPTDPSAVPNRPRRARMSSHGLQCGSHGPDSGSHGPKCGPKPIQMRSQIDPSAIPNRSKSGPKPVPVDRFGVPLGRFGTDPSAFLGSIWCCGGAHKGKNVSVGSFWMKMCPELRTLHPPLGRLYTTSRGGTPAI